MADFDVIEQEIDTIAETELNIPELEPIVIKGSGNVTLFGLCNSFSTEFPNRLKGRVAPEEFSETMNRINGVLQKHTPINLRWLLCGCVFCCCTIGCSMWPVCCLNKRTKRALEKALDWENFHLYNKLGLRLLLSKQRNDTTGMSEYVLLLQYLPKSPIMLPD